MVDPVLKRRGRLALVVVVVLLLLSSPLWLRTVSFFDVRRVEVIGARYLDAETIVANLHLDAGHSIYRPLGALKAKVFGVAGVEAVEIERHLPATLRIAIVERTPVALVPAQDGMIALDSEARPLPYDPARVSLDLPVVATTDKALTDAISLVRGLDASMYTEVIGARRNEDGNILLEFHGQSVVLGSTPSIGDILKVTAVRRHLAETGAVYDLLDARFEGSVVARRPQV